MSEKHRGFDMNAEESKSFMDKGEFTSEAKGGELEPSEDEIDDELQQSCCDEFIQALEQKDKKGILDSLRALVLSCKG